MHGMPFEGVEEHGVVGGVDSRNCSLPDVSRAGAGIRKRELFGVSHVSRLVEAERSEAAVYLASVVWRRRIKATKKPAGSKANLGRPPQTYVSGSSARGLPIAFALDESAPCVNTPRFFYAR